MSVYKCKMCGGNLEIINAENGLCECDSCGSTQTVPIQDNAKKPDLYNTANEYRKNNRFDRAADVYRNMVQEFPEEAEAYWGMVLCRYGIEYVKDPKTGKMMPTCHRTIPKSIFDDADYRLACEKSKALAREQHEKEAQEIDTIQKKIFMLAQKEEPYDIFISYKEQEDGTRERTQDSVLAQDIYDRFTAEGYKVFFSKISLENRLGEDYEPIIYSALRSAKVMLLVGTSREHMNAPWVRNEWTRYLDMMEEEPDKKTLIPVYSHMDPYDIPSEISGRHLQAQDAGKIGFQQDLLHGVKKVLKSSHSYVAPVSYSGGSYANTGGMLERGFICLKDRNFEEAESVFNKVLDIDPHSGGAYLGRLMIRRRVSDVDQLEDQKAPMSMESDYQHAIEYGEPKIKKKLRDFETKIIKENKDRASDFVRKKTVEIDVTLRKLKQELHENKNEIDNLNEILQKQKHVVENNEKVLSAKKIAKYVILALHVLFWLPSIITNGSNADIMSIVDIIAAVLIWKFIIKKFIVGFVQKIVGKVYGQVSDWELSQIIATIDEAEKELKESVELDSELSAKIEEADKKLNKLEKDKEILVEKLSLAPQEVMDEVLETIVE